MYACHSISNPLLSEHIKVKLYRGWLFCFINPFFFLCVLRIVYRRIFYNYGRNPQKVYMQGLESLFWRGQRRWLLIELNSHCTLKTKLKVMGVVGDISCKVASFEQTNIYEKSNTKWELYISTWSYITTAHCFFVC